jgi:hypothetical protein
MRKVYTFYWPGGRNAPPLLDMWRRSWQKHGWAPTVLTEADYKDHPMLPAMRKRIATLPTVNGRDYEDRCYLRWLAFDTAAPGVFTDFDVMNYGMTPENVIRFPEGSGRIHAYSHNGPPNPGVFVADQSGIRALLNNILHGKAPIDHKIRPGQQHVSDMYYFQELAEKHPGKPLCVNCSYEGWRKAPMVHWHNTGIHRLQRHPKDRAAVIQELRPV